MSEKKREKPREKPETMIFHVCPACLVGGFVSKDRLVGDNAEWRCEWCGHLMILG
jgi:hypothetical protein